MQELFVAQYKIRIFLVYGKVMISKDIVCIPHVE